jgi:hypothetical protein
MSFFLLQGGTFKIFSISLYPTCAQYLATEVLNLNQNYIKIFFIDVPRISITFKIFFTNKNTLY